MKRGSNSALNKTVISIRAFPWSDITVLDETDSTNDWLKEHGEKHGQTVIAKKQTHGKGTKGRSFASPGDTGLYMSIMLKEIPDINGIKLITPAAAVAVCEALEIICGVSPQIKWVNDIYLPDKKVCGILTEAAYNSDGSFKYAVIGIGINLFEPEGGFGELSDTAGAVLKKGRGRIFNFLAAEIINRVRFYCDNLQKKEFLQGYREKSCVVGKNITVALPSGSFDAYAEEITDDCGLKVKKGDEEIILSSADVSIKFKE